ncbi:hypothetical protein FOL47_010025 [Perkinsus chesapeaki]|uniref:Uncharacterized protein n=1 Tax=Perkinsus chesapeaki TaxID=330153 RepID=A0A7J6L596_PERCH|nr:hypothetical protein FOL47_010025 [Perkinsus chesapeaki]
MRFFYVLGLELSILLWGQISHVKALMYGAVWANGDRKLTILCPDDRERPAYLSISTGICIGLKYNYRKDVAVEFTFRWYDPDVRSYFIEELNYAGVLPGEVRRNGLKLVVFRQNVCGLDVGYGMAVGELINHDSAERMYDAMTCEE